MKNNKKWAMGLLLSTAVLLAGCKAPGDSVTLIDEPKLSDEKQVDMQEVLDKLLPTGYEYATAENIDEKQAIFTEDINNDGKQEGFVLYHDPKENQLVHLLVLEESGGSWAELSDIDTSYNYLDYFKLTDLNGDGIKEVVIGVGLSEKEPKRQLLIYDFNDNKLKNTVGTTYEWIDAKDYDGDNKSDLFLLNGEVNTSQIAELYDYENGQLNLKSSLELTPDAYHENIVNGKLADGQQAVFIDSGYGAHSMLTEIVSYSKGKLIKVGDEYDGNLLKEYPLYSKDINKDGIIEVGGMYIPKGYEDAAFAEIPFIYTYNDYQLDGTFKTIEQRYYGEGQDFYITIPSEWYNKVTIEKLDNGVKLLDSKTQKTLFDVKWSDLASASGTGIELGKTKDTYFYTDNKEDMPIAKDNFHLLEDDFK